jgi:RNA polymerase sigma-70 factor, ECF subfamily
VPEDLAALYDAHAAAVYALALRITRDAADAEDVTQEVFLQAWRSEERFDAARGSRAAWLLVMARSRSLDRLRSRRRRPADAVEPARLDAIPNAAAGVDVIAATQQEASRAYEAMTVLPAEQREAIELAYFEGCSHTEIAARTGQPLGTVKTRIRSAMQQLRAALKGGRA